MAAQIESILDKARKVLALAERGVGGEALAAKAALDALLKKHGLTIDDLRQTRRIERKFTVRGKEERCVLLHCLLKMFGRASDVTKSACKYKRDRAIYVEMSEIEFLDFKPFFAFHLRQYRKECKKLMDTVTTAYVNKHNLFADDSPSAPKDMSDIDWETLCQVMKVSQTMEDVSYYKSLE
ncbi:hypothetical protein [Alistipes putredinis]|uniref:hypothetical protein n=1 Tax=Alistipes putredinis TaxID=28117 RepID=UPI00242AD329|nr:hypothetical protein [Alistipes putredinis]